MIGRKTVFVLGAGASNPYGYPLGFELHKALCSGETYSDDLMNIFDACDVDSVEVMRFRSALLRSSLPSIDAFLARRPTYERIGKLAIASQILAKENIDKTIRPGNDDDWFGWLWNRMTIDALEPRDVLSNDVSFITFNYDRSLEALLYQAFLHSFGMEEDAAGALASRFEILHVYGRVENPHANQYRPDFNARTLSVAASGIRVIEEARQDDKLFERARMMVDAAEVVCFLGFGFDQLNLRRLALPAVFDHRLKTGRRARILASAYKMTVAERGEAQEAVCGSQNWEVLDLPNREFLRNIRW